MLLQQSCYMRWWKKTREVGKAQVYLRLLCLLRSALQAYDVDVCVFLEAQEALHTDTRMRTSRAENHVFNNQAAPGHMHQILLDYCLCAGDIRWGAVVH